VIKNLFSGDFSVPIDHYSKFKTEDGINIDYISVSSDFFPNISNFIDNYFDLDFCKCWYDGTKIYSNFHENIINMSCNLKEILLI